MGLDSRDNHCPGFFVTKVRRNADLLQRKNLLTDSFRQQPSIIQH